MALGALLGRPQPTTYHSALNDPATRPSTHDEFTAKFRQQSARIVFLQRENSLLKERMLHMECVSMSSNLIISGLPESSSEAEDDLYQTLITLFDKILLIDDAQDMLISRCHRLSRHQGPFNKDRPRAVVVRFTHCPDRMKVLRGPKNLKDHEPQLYINESFLPKLIEDGRCCDPFLRKPENAVYVQT